MLDDWGCGELHSSAELLALRRNLYNLGSLLVCTRQLTTSVLIARGHVSVPGTKSVHTARHFVRTIKPVA